jgi:hypothetical protein
MFWLSETRTVTYLQQKKAKIDFCLRVTKYNKGIQMKHQGIRFKSLEL